MCFRVLKRAVSSRLFFWVPTHALVEKYEKIIFCYALISGGLLIPKCNWSLVWHVPLSACKTLVKTRLLQNLNIGPSILLSLESGGNFWHCCAYLKSLGNHVPWWEDARYRFEAVISWSVINLHQKKRGTHELADLRLWWAHIHSNELLTCQVKLTSL